MSVKEQIEKVNKEIEELKFQLAVKEAVLVCLQDSIVKKGRKRGGKNGAPPKKGSLAARLKEVLSDSEGPKTVGELVTALRDKGVESESKTGLDILIPSAIARRKDIFVTIRRGVYDLKTRAKQENQIE